jgi:hypothetical protein
MGDRKLEPTTLPSPAAPEDVTSFIRAHTASDVPPDSLRGAAPRLDAESFLEDWSMRHFTASVRLHDAARICAGDAEGARVLEEIGVMQGVLLDLHELASGSPEVRVLMTELRVLQNAVDALYLWLDGVVDAVIVNRRARRRLEFADAGDGDSLAAIEAALERLHPDLLGLLRAGLEAGPDERVARSLSSCVRQVGAVVVRVTGGRGSTLPPG